MKNEILMALRNTGGQYMSGEMLSQTLGVSRTAIWKHIKNLKAEGYIIESVTHKGYRLVDSPTDIDSSQLTALFHGNALIEGVYFYETIDSTNNEVKRLENKHPNGNVIVLAREQTLGKGRLGRTWVSNKDAGIWMSLLLRPRIRPEMASQMTLIAAAAVSQAIENVSGLTTGIKWPNDVVVGGKKISGILTEMSAELNQIHYVVLGIGINMTQMVFDETLSDKATSVKKETGNDVSRLNLIKEFVECFEMYYNQFVSASTAHNAMAYNRSKSVTIGKEVSIVREGQTKTAYANTIDDAGNLIVTYTDGTQESLYYGEVSVRGINGYVPT